MRDLLQDYVIIAQDCIGVFLYEEFYPLVHPNFIAYNTPLIGTQFFEDLDFIWFCENYDYYMNLEPKFIRHTRIGNFYAPDVLLGDIKIYMKHDPPFVDDKPTQDALLEKWNGRAKLGKGKTKIYVWSCSNAMQLHTEMERVDLLNRFKRLDGYSFFLTQTKEDEFEDERHVVKVYPEFVGHGLTEWRAGGSDGGLAWHYLTLMPPTNIHAEYSWQFIPFLKDMIIRKLPDIEINALKKETPK